MSTGCKVLGEMGEPLIAGLIGKTIMCNGMHVLVIVLRV